MKKTTKRETPQDRYCRKNLQRRAVNFNRSTDPDIIEFLEGVDNFQGYIKSLIRADIQRRAGGDA